MASFLFLGFHIPLREPIPHLLAGDLQSLVQTIRFQGLVLDDHLCSLQQEVLLVTLPHLYNPVVGRRREVLQLHFKWIKVTLFLLVEVVQDTTESHRKPTSTPDVLGIHFGLVKEVKYPRTKSGKCLKTESKFFTQHLWD